MKHERPPRHLSPTPIVHNHDGAGALPTLPCERVLSECARTLSELSPIRTRYNDGTLGSSTAALPSRIATSAMTIITMKTIPLAQRRVLDHAEFMRPYVTWMWACCVDERESEVRRVHYDGGTCVGGSSQFRCPHCSQRRTTEKNDNKKSDVDHLCGHFEHWIFEADDQHSTLDCCWCMQKHIPNGAACCLRDCLTARVGDKAPIRASAGHAVCEVKPQQQVAP